MVLLHQNFWHKNHVPESEQYITYQRPALFVSWTLDMYLNDKRIAIKESLEVSNSLQKTRLFSHANTNIARQRQSGIGYLGKNNGVKCQTSEQTNVV